MPSSSASSVDIVDLAHSYRRLVLWVGAQLLFGVIANLSSLPVGDSTIWQAILPLLAVVLIWVTLGALVVYGYRTAQALGAAVPVLWAVAMFFPCINLITLLVLSSRATKACRERGVPVGFLGPDLEAARRQGTEGMADAFGESPEIRPR